MIKTLSSIDDLAEIRTRIMQVTASDARQWGSMSAHGMLCHLRDAIGCPLGERVPAPVKRPAIPLPLYKWLAFRLPVKWPPGIPTPPEMDQRLGGTPPNDFAKDRAALLDKLDLLARAAGPFGPHPMFGEMTRTEWMRWGYLHCDHHLRQFGR